MRTITLALVLGLLLATPAVVTAAAAAESGPTWYADFDKAVEAAKAEGKDLLVDFTGSDWCGWCKRLHSEVFEQQAFKDGVKDRWVLVALDFPRSPEVKAKVPNPARNDELMKKYGIRGFPTILLMTVDGEVYARTGYQRGGAEKYVSHLDEITKKGKEALAKVAEILKSYEAAAAEEKPALVENALSLLAAEQPGSPVAMKLLALVKNGMALDPKNEQGLKLKCIESLMEKDMADGETLKAAVDLDSKNEKGLYERALMARFRRTSPDDKEAVKALLADVEAFAKLGAVKDKNLGLGLMANSAWCAHQFLNDNGLALKFVEKLESMGGAENPRLKGLIDRIRGAAAKPAEEGAEKK